MTNRIRGGIIDTESIKSAAREWGWAYASLFSAQSLAYTAIVLWFGMPGLLSNDFYPAFIAMLRDIGIAGLAAVVITTTILEGAQSAIMIISAPFLKPRERRIREEGREQGRAESAQATQAAQADAQAARADAQAARADAQAAAQAAAWREWYLLSELAKAKGEEPPPPPFFSSGDNGQSNGQTG